MAYLKICFLFLYFGVLLIIPAYSKKEGTTQLKCADEMCSTQIAYGKTTQGYRSPSQTTLSCKPDQEVIVYGKYDAGSLKVSKVKIAGIEGFLPQRFIREYKTIIKDAELTYEVLFDDQLSPISKETEEHNIEMSTQDPNPSSEGFISSEDDSGELDTDFGSTEQPMELSPERPIKNMADVKLEMLPSLPPSRPPAEHQTPDYVETTSDRESGTPTATSQGTSSNVHEPSQTNEYNQQSTNNANLNTPTSTEVWEGVQSSPASAVPSGSSQFDDHSVTNVQSQSNTMEFSQPLPPNFGSSDMTYESGNMQDSSTQHMAYTATSTLHHAPTVMQDNPVAFSGNENRGVLNEQGQVDSFSQAPINNGFTHSHTDNVNSFTSTNNEYNYGPADNVNSYAPTSNLEAETTKAFTHTDHQNHNSHWQGSDTSTPVQHHENNHPSTQSVLQNSVDMLEKGNLHDAPTSESIYSNNVHYGAKAYQVIGEETEMPMHSGPSVVHVDGTPIIAEDNFYAEHQHREFGSGLQTSQLEQNTESFVETTPALPNREIHNTGNTFDATSIASSSVQQSVPPVTSTIDGFSPPKEESLLSRFHSNSAGKGNSHAQAIEGSLDENMHIDTPLNPQSEKFEPEPLAGQTTSDSSSEKTTSESVTERPIFETETAEPIPEEVTQGSTSETGTADSIPESIAESVTGDSTADTVTSDSTTGTVTTEPTSDFMIGKIISESVIGKLIPGSIIGEPLQDSETGKPIPESVTEEPMSESVTEESIAESVTKQSNLDSEFITDHLNVEVTTETPQDFMPEPPLNIEQIIPEENKLEINPLPDVNPEEFVSKTTDASDASYENPTQYILEYVLGMISPIGTSMRLMHVYTQQKSINNLQLYLQFGSNLSEALEDSPQTFTSGTSILLIAISITITTLYAIHMIMNKCSRESSLLAAMNSIQREMRMTQEQNMELRKRQSSFNGQKAPPFSSTKDFAKSKEEVQKLKEKYEALLQELNLKETKVQHLEQELEESTANGMELHKMLNELLSNQKETSNFQESVDSLQKMLDGQREKVESLTSDLALKTRLNDELRNELKTTKQRASKLEYQMEQLSHSLEEVNSAKVDALKKIENESTTVSTLSKSNEHLTKEINEKKANIEALTKQMETLKNSLKKAKSSLNGKEAQLQVSKECLKKLQGASAKDKKLADIFNIVDVKSQLVALEKERDEVTTELTETQREQAEVYKELKALESEIGALRDNEKQARSERNEAISKLEVLTNYFKEKETELTKELESTEYLRLDAEGSASSTANQLQTYQMELESCRAQIGTLKSEIEEQKQSYKMQLTNEEKKSHENWLAARTAERRQEELRQENSQLRQRFTLLMRDGDNMKGLPKRAETNGNISSPGSTDGDLDHPSLSLDPHLPPIPPMLPPMFPGGPPPPMGAIPPPHILGHFPPPPPGGRLPPAGRIASPPFRRGSPPPFDRRSYSPSSDHSHYSDRRYSPHNSRYSPSGQRRPQSPDRRSDRSRHRYRESSPRGSPRWYTRSPEGFKYSKDEYYYDIPNNDRRPKKGQKTSTPLAPNDR